MECEEVCEIETASKCSKWKECFKNDPAAFYLIEKYIQFSKQVEKNKNFRE